MNATEKQVSYIISLYNKAHGGGASYLSQCVNLGLNNRQKKGGMTKAEASAIIDDLLAQAK